MIYGLSSPGFCRRTRDEEITGSVFDAVAMHRPPRDRSILDELLQDRRACARRLVVRRTKLDEYLIYPRLEKGSTAPRARSPRGLAPARTAPCRARERSPAGRAGSH